MLVKTYGSALYGIDALIITIEVNVDKGVGYHLVGLPDNAVKESNHRIGAALKNCGYKIPGKKITINMAPADLRKEGSAYDLPLALGILSASSQIEPKNLENYLIMGELGLDGKLVPIKGALSIAIEAQKKGFKGFILPKENENEASVVKGLDIYGANNINEVVNHLEDKKLIPKAVFKLNNDSSHLKNQKLYDFNDVKGQENVKRALEIAAAGGHNILMIGPPGSGKTMLAKRITSILPSLSLHEALETSKIHSIIGRLDSSGLLTQRPFRSPHHTISNVALVGGGSYPQPGEISMAHNGVLFLDELPEFQKSVLEVMRQPLEDREITISRARFTVNYPCSFMLVASMNPTPSGFFPDDERNTSSPTEISRYQNKLSGPLLDRIDIHVEVTPLKFEEMSQKRKGESSAVIRQRVEKARSLQLNRFKESPHIHYNAQMDTKAMDSFCQLDETSTLLLERVVKKLNFSARSFDRILRVARTIADLDDSLNIKSNHIAEAIQYRTLDRNS